MQHVSDAHLYRPDPVAPKRKWLQPSIAEADPVVIYDRSPNISQPFRLANGATPTEFVPGNSYWLRAPATDCSPARGRDIVLDLNIIA